MKLINGRDEPCEYPEKKKTECLRIMTCERSVKGIILKHQYWKIIVINYSVAYVFPAIVKISGF